MLAISNAKKKGLWGSGTKGGLDHEGSITRDFLTGGK